MHHKRFLKNLLVVLALALWASTAYASGVTAVSTTPPTLGSYTQFTQTAPTGLSAGVAVTITGGSGTFIEQFTSQSPTNWLALTTCDGSSTCGLSINSYPALDAMTAGTATATLTFYDSTDTEFTTSVGTAVINLTVVAGHPTLTASSPTSISYTQFQSGTAARTSTVQSSNEDRTTYTDAYTSNISTCPWLTAASTNTSATDGSGDITSVGNKPFDTLTFTVVKSVADALPTGSNPCSLTITYAGGTIPIIIPMTITGGTPTLTASSSTIALGNYAKDSNAVVTSSIGITSNDDSGGPLDAYSASTTCGWLTLSSVSTSSATGGTVSKASPDTLNLTVNTASANALALGAAAACNVAITYGVTPVATAPITLTVTPPVYATGTPFTVNLTYAKNGGASQAGATHSITVSSYDASPDTYTSVHTACPAWLDVTNAGQASLSTADTLTFTIDATAANLIAPTTSPVSCNVPLAYTGTQFATVSLNLTITGMPMTASQSAITLIYAKTGGSSQPTASATVTVSSEDTLSDTYTVDTTSCSAYNYLDVATAHAHAASLAQSDTLTFSIDTTNGNAATVSSHSCNAVLKYSGTPFATIPLTLNIVNLGTLTAATPTLALGTYTKGGIVPTALGTTVSDTSSATSPYTFTVSNVPNWLSCLTKANTTTGTVEGTTTTDTVTCSVVTTGAGAANSLNAGPETATIHLVVPNEADTLVNVTLLIKAAVSPLSSNVSPVNLTYWLSGGSSQAAASVNATISSTDPLYDTYAVTAGYPNWLSVSSANTFQTKNGTPDTLTLSVVTGNVPAAGTYQTALTLQIDANNPPMTLIVNLNVVAQPAVATPASISLTYTKSGGSTTTGPLTVKLLPGTTGTSALTLDAYTVPVWMNVAGFPTSATAAAASGNISFTVNTTVAASMATGNYTATVTMGVGNGAGMYATHLAIPVTLLISNSTPSLSLQEGASGSTIQKIVAKSATGPPPPTFTPYSSDEPIPFTAVCVLTTTENYTVTPASCVLSSTSGIAYTLGYGMTAALDPTLFSSLTATYGNTVTVKVTITPTGGGGAAVNLTYVYTLQPLTPTITAISPTSVAVPTTANQSNSLVVLLTGTNFVGPEDVYYSGGVATICPTQVWLGAAANALTTGYVVLSPTQLEVTIPEALIPAIASGKTSNTLTIGIANQTQTSCPGAYATSTTLKVTTSPVIYALTSTATYAQPAPGGTPGVAPYELISIFGDQFGFALNASANATLNAYYQVPTALMIGGTAAHPVNLTVAFTPVGGKASSALAAPILFANQNQINAIVPSGLVAGTAYDVTVTSGALAASDPFVVNGVYADPGVFTLASDGSGQGAILNDYMNGDYADYVGTINGSTAGHAVTAGDIVSVYLTGLGTPDSTAVDSTSDTPNPSGFPNACVEINGSKSLPGYMQIANTLTVAPNAATGVVGWTPPKTSAAWTTIDGAEIQSDLILGTPGVLLPPCFTDSITVTFGTGPTAVTATTGNGLVTWAGFTDGSVAGLYQINVQIPPNNPLGAQPIQVSMTNSNGTFTSPPNALTANTVTIQLH